MVALNHMSWEKEIQEIEKRKQLALLQGGESATAKQHKKGRLTIRERISALVDPGSFEELGLASGAASTDASGSLTSFEPANFLVGFGKVDGRRIVVGGEDFTMKGGSPSTAGLRKSIYAEDLALQYKVPLVRLHEGAGGSVGGSSGKATSTSDPVYSPPRFRSVAKAMGTVPVATAALGAVAGLPAGRLVASHFSVMSKATAQILTAGPAVVARAMGEQKSKEELGGWKVHTKNGTVDNGAEDEIACLNEIKKFLSYMPNNIHELAPRLNCDDPIDRKDPTLSTIVPRDRRKSFDMRLIINRIVDHSSFFEIGAGYGRSQITGLARLNGQPVGIWANDCKFLAGSMTADGADKARRFMELCELFSLPIVALVDEPGFMIGSQAEKESTIRRGTAAVLTAAMSTVPWASVMIRRSFGVAQAAHYGPDGYVIAWPSAESGPLPVEGGVAVAFQKEIAAAPDPEARRRELEQEFSARQSPFPRSESFGVHDIINPAETRPELCRWIDRVAALLPALLGSAQFHIRP